MKLVIVESPTKAKTISKFLGKDYKVESSFGHIRDLPKSKLGVDVENNFEPSYVIPTKAKKRVTELKKLAKDADEIILATDEDREGEAIAWHLLKALKIEKKPVSRIVFHEITESAINEALEKPRQIDEHLVDSQQTRRILDRLVGYKLSPLLWKKVRRGLSAGRVQSVAVRMIVERERERQAFNKEEYWSITAEFPDFEAKLSKRDGKKLDKMAIKSEAEAKEVVDAVTGKPFKISEIDKKQTKRKPPTPFRTSVLQQVANTTLGYSAKQTMMLAQKLYETGHITYMRTDSLNLADKFLNEAQTFLQSVYGDKYAKGSKKYAASQKGAQEAHEAIRPTDIRKTPDTLKLEPKQKKLYDLIWRRTLASQMPEAILEKTGIDLEADKYTFRANGSTIVFDGFMKVYKAAKETILPPLEKGQELTPDKVTPKQHFTEPPARYSDATLVKALEEHGIGRPSTYAPTISTVITRGYVDRDDSKKLFPTDIAMIVTDLLTEHFEYVSDYDFTAKLEQSLDEIAEGKIEWIPVLEGFYGPFSQKLEVKEEELKREDIMPTRNLGKEPESGLDMLVKTGRYGPYIQLGEWDKDDKEAPKPKMVSLLKSMTMESVTKEEALKLLELPKDMGNDITLLLGPYGPYLKSGKTNITVPADINPLELTSEEAQKIFTEGAEKKKEMLKPIAELGKDPTSDGDIVIKNGRYGPYVTDGKTNASIKKSLDPKEVTLEQAVEMLAKKRKK